MNVLLLNAGSSSLKGTLASLPDSTIRARVLADWAGNKTKYHYIAPDEREHNRDVAWKGHAPAVRQFLQDLTETLPVAMSDPAQLAAVGHRVVHGGPFTNSVQVTADLRTKLADLAHLAPLHNPPSLETLAAAESELPDVPHVAVFDTAFHATLPPYAYTYPVPHDWTENWGVRKYGFHGLSHAYCARRANEMLESTDTRLVICHLGHGCSASAVFNGKCVDTTMGFTPLEGLMMATRSGSVDPGLLLHVQQHQGLTAAQIERMLNRESGLLGVSGVSADMREVQAEAHSGNASAQLALTIYAHRVRQAIGAFAATLGGIDALVFTAGVGENSSEMRTAICNKLRFLGLHLDPQANADCDPDADIASAESPGRILVIETREDLTMLSEIRRVLGNNDSISETATSGGETRHH